MHTIKKFRLIVVFTTLLVACTTIVYANWGATPYGGDGYGFKRWGANSAVSGATYWETAYGTDWTVAYGTDWTKAYNTVVP